MKKMLLFLTILCLFGCSKNHDNNLTIINKTTNKIKAISYHSKNNSQGFSHSDGKAITQDETFAGYIEGKTFYLNVTDMNNNVYKSGEYVIDNEEINCVKIENDDNNFLFYVGCDKTS